MGILDTAVQDASQAAGENSAVPGGDYIKPLMIAAGVLLVGKFFGGGGASAPAQQAAEAPASGGILGQLGGLVSGLAGGLLGAAAGGLAQAGQSGGALGGGTLGGLAGSLAGAAENAAVSGGLGSLVDQFRNAGLGAQVESWIGTGGNHPITAEQINSVLGQGKIAEMAQAAGIDPAQMSQMLAQALPHLVDKLTPGGQLPQG